MSELQTDAECVSAEKLEYFFAMKSRSDVRPGDRIFYEMGKYIRKGRKGNLLYDNRKGSEMFIEIEDVGKWLEQDSNLDDLEYLKRRNFTIHRKKG